MMKMHFISFICLLVIIQSQLLQPWYKNLYCAGGFYELENFISYSESIPIETDFSPIRIFIDYTNFDSQCENGNTFNNICTYQGMVKEQLSKAANLMEKIINVKRFTKNIKFSDDLLKNQLKISNYDSVLNEGVSYDYVIILSINEAAQINQKILGFQGDPRVFEPDTKRPILGTILIFNNDYKHMANKEHFLLHSFIHQIIHLLVFHPKLIKQFPIEGAAYIDAKDYTQYRTMIYINTPKVVEYGKRHFNNDNYFGAHLDITSNQDMGMFHWYQRFMLGDLMIPELYQEQALSEITLGLFEDSTWYKVNYYTGGLFRFGKGESNPFLREKCFNDKSDINDNYDFQTDFCDEENQKRCTTGRMAKGFCKFYIDSVPDQFRYWPTNSTKGGRKLNDYCPVAEREDSNVQLMYNFYPGDCKVGSIFREGLSEVMSDHSFCAVSRVYPSNSDLSVYGVTQRGVCYPMYCSDTKLTVQIGNFYVVCKKNGGIEKMPAISGFSGGFECPHYNTICTGTVVCNSIEDCILKKSEVKVSTYTYEGTSYEFQQLVLDKVLPTIVNKGEESENGKCGKNCIYCKVGNSCLQCREGEYSIGSKYNDKTDNNYLYCDLTSSFTSDNYEEYNGIYYPKNDNTIQLSYINYYDLLFIENKWQFKIKVSTSNLNNNDNTMIDIKINDVENKAKCVMNINGEDNILNCVITYNDQSIEDEIKLIKNSENGKLVWTNLPDVVNMYIDYQIKFINVFGGYYNNKWNFNVYHETNEEIQADIKGYKILLNILVNDAESTATCEVISKSCLKCISNHDNQKSNDVIKIVRNTEHNSGYVYFLENISSEKNVMKPLTLYINYNNNQANVNAENVLTLLINGKLSNKIDHPIEKDTLTKIEILIKENETSEKKEINCFTDYIGKEKGSEAILECQFNIVGDEELEINIDANGFSKYAHFNLVQNIKITGVNEKEEDSTDSKATDSKTTDTTKEDNNDSDEKSDNKGTDDNEYDDKDDDDDDDDIPNNYYFIRSYKNNLGLLLMQLFLLLLIE